MYRAIHYFTKCSQQIPCKILKNTNPLNNCQYILELMLNKLTTSTKLINLQI